MQHKTHACDGQYRAAKSKISLGRQCSRVGRPGAQPPSQFIYSAKNERAVHSLPEARGLLLRGQRMGQGGPVGKGDVFRNSSE